MSTGAAVRTYNVLLGRGSRRGRGADRRRLRWRHCRKPAGDAQPIATATSPCSTRPRTPRGARGALRLQRRDRRHPRPHPRGAARRDPPAMVARRAGASGDGAGAGHPLAAALLVRSARTRPAARGLRRLSRGAHLRSLRRSDAVANRSRRLLRRDRLGADPARGSCSTWPRRRRRRGRGSPAMPAAPRRSPVCCGCCRSTAGAASASCRATCSAAVGTDAGGFRRRRGRRPPRRAPSRRWWRWGANISAAFLRRCARALSPPAALRPAFLPVALVAAYLAVVAGAPRRALSRSRPTSRTWRRHWLLPRRFGRRWPSTSQLTRKRQS